VVLANVPLFILVVLSACTTKMAINKLTDLQCNAAKPHSSTYKLSDGGSLYLVIHHNGGKYWRLRFGWWRPDDDRNPKKKQRELALGTYPAVTLRQAREGAAKAKQHLAAGRDPVVEFQKEKAKRRDQLVATFRSEAKIWWDKRVEKGKWTPKHSEHIWRSFERHIFPHIGDRSVTDIPSPDILRILEGLSGQMPIRMHQRVFAVFRSAKTRGKIKDNPAEIDTDELVTPQKGEFAYLEFKDVPEYLRKLDADTCSPQLRIACKMLVHTFLRRNELRLVMWAHVDWEEKLLHLPGHVMKNKRDFEVPLTPEVIDLLDELAPMTGDSPFLFPHRDSPNTKPMGDSSMALVLNRIGYRGLATLHGFRKTASTTLNNAGYHKDAIERQLDHVDVSVRGVYNKAQYMEHRRVAMEAWSNAIITGEIVKRKGGDAET